MGDLRLGQKLINYLRFQRKVQPEDMQRVIFYLEDDKFQEILDVNIFAPLNSDLRIAQYQKMNIQEYMTYHKKKKRKKKDK